MAKRKYVRLSIENIESDIATAYALGYANKAYVLRSYFAGWLDEERLEKKKRESRKFAEENDYGQQSGSVLVKPVTNESDCQQGEQHEGQD